MVAKIPGFRLLLIFPCMECPVGTVAGKGYPLRANSGASGERRCSSYSFLTTALEGGEWSASRSGRALPPGKEPPVPVV
jgi:hypothetical protein